MATHWQLLQGSDETHHLRVAQRRNLRGEKTTTISLANGQRDSNRPDLSPLEDASPGKEGGELRFLLADRWVDLNAGGRRGGAALRANIEPHSYQYRPLLKFFTTAERRLLIADETGLGKTVEACMIIAETFAAAGGKARILVMVPAVSISKWKRDLYRQFGLRSSELAGSFQKFFQSTGTRHGIWICSHDKDREADTVDCQSGDLDLLVIDELHRFIGRTDGQKRRKRALSLSIAAKAMVGLTATPIQIEVQDLQRVLSIVAPEAHQQEVFQSQVLIQKACNRICTAWGEGLEATSDDIDVLTTHVPNLPALPSRLPEGEQGQHLLHAVRDAGPIGRRMTRARARDPDVSARHLGRTVLTHQVECSEEWRKALDAVDAHLREHQCYAHRLQFLSCPAAMRTILDGGDTASAMDAYFAQYTPTTSAVDKILQQHPVFNHDANEDPKVGLLCEILRELRERHAHGEISKTVVFTHWLPTANHVTRAVAARLKADNIEFHSTYSQDGGAEQSEKIIERFRESEGFAVLLVTDKFSESIDLDMANAIINLDLPFNPAVLQQRIGRIDRPVIQEMDHIEVHNLIFPGTPEEDIFHRLKERIGAFTGTIGGMEHLLNSEESSEQGLTTEEAEDAYDEALASYDKHRIAQSDVVLSVVDRFLDGEIAEMRANTHPVHAMLWKILQAGFTRLGGECTYDDDVLSVRIHKGLLTELLEELQLMQNDPVHALMVGALHSPDDGPASFELTVGGRKGILGPYHPLLCRFEEMLAHVEGMFTPLEVEPALIKSNESNGWRDATTKESVETNALLGWNLDGAKFKITANESQMIRRG